MSKIKAELKAQKRPPYHFGEKLRLAREQKGYTLKIIAEAVGVSESLISQIEHNKVSPAIDTLLALADFLDINLEYLFDEYHRERPVKIVRANERRFIKDESVTYESLSPSFSQGSQNVFETYTVVLPAGARTKRGSYGHIGQELGVITKGSVELVYENNRYTLSEGDSVSFSASAPHSLENNTKVQAEAIWIVTPPQRFFAS
ncbi:MAG: helix-turn-helix transcriptional regulator [Treponema sp.]|nr:helix-turn-helix transcriptional regulator [Treponema sp.]